MGRARKASTTHGQRIDTTPQWEGNLTPTTLEELTCESTLGGCGHGFNAHRNYSDPSIPGMYCLTCRDITDKKVERQATPGTAAASALRQHWRQRECQEFVNGLVQHMDATALLNAPIRTTTGKPTTSPRHTKEEVQAALKLLGLEPRTRKRKP